MVKGLERPLGIGFGSSAELKTCLEGMFIPHFTLFRPLFSNSEIFWTSGSLERHLGHDTNESSYSLNPIIIGTRDFTWHWQDNTRDE